MADILSFPAPPPTASSTIPDQEQREQALQTDQSWIVEAPAGSGKTGLLIQRFLKLLATPQVTQPGQVLAVTFTRKATAEMRERVLGQLRAAAEATEPKNAFDRATRAMAEAVLHKDRQLGWNLLETPARLNIRTIDSVCVDLAGSLPILSGAGSGVAPTQDAATLYDEAAHRTLMLLGGDDPQLTAAIRDLLLHRDGNLGDCRSLIARMLGWRDQWGELIPLAPSKLTDAYLDGTVLPKLNRALDVAICRSLTELTRVLSPSGVLPALSALAAEMARSDGYPAGNASPLAFCAGRHMPPEEKGAHLDHWHALIDLLLTKDGDFRSLKGIHKGFLKFDIEKHHKADLVAIIDQLRPDDTLRELLCRIRTLPPAEYPAEQWPTAKSVFRVLSRALVELQLVFAARQQTDFTETALQARAALRRDADRQALRGNSTLDLQHLLVDEMQDTSSAQYDLIQLLTQSWDGRGQTVFLVGDPKQSIYLFRQARVERFVETMLHGRLGELDLGVLRLTANFRSQQRLVAAFNATFSGMFPAESDATQPEIVPYRHADAIRPPASKAAGQVWHAAVLPYSDDKDLCAQQKQAQRRAHASEIREVVQHWITRSAGGEPKPPSMAVLVRNRRHLVEVVAAFRQAPAIPYRAVKIEPLAERREILDLLALTRALLHPADRTAWLALLRTPWCGLSLADLHTLAAGDDPSQSTLPVLQLLQTRGDLLSDDGISRLQPFWLILQQALQAKAVRPLARVIELTWRAFGADRAATEEEHSNCLRLFELLEELEAAGPLALEPLNLRLKDLYAQPANLPGAVDLLTMHTAKGLEWDLVFLPALERIGAGNKGRLLDWLETEGDNPFSGPEVAPGILALMAPRGSESLALNDWIKSVEKARESAERSRLFYVGCTRAREELHLFGTVDQNKEGGMKNPTAGSLLHAAWQAAEPEFGLAYNRLQDAQSGEEQQEGLALAAAASVRVRVDAGRLITRLPLSSMTVPATVPVTADRAAAGAPFLRPEGSLKARAFGNAMHTLLEYLAARVAAEDQAIATAVLAALSAELPGWRPRIAALLRAGGIPPAELEQYTADILHGLQNTLATAEGRWLLLPHTAAASEQALLVRAGSAAESAISTLRLDRTFLAGPEPLSTGASHRWIVDYKTATPGRESLQDFLRHEEETYRPQLESYAAHFSAAAEPVRMALFYPALGVLHVLR